MTVRELIAALGVCDPDLPVIFDGPEGLCEIRRVIAEQSLPLYVGPFPYTGPSNATLLTEYDEAATVAIGDDDGD